MPPARIRNGNGLYMQSSFEKAHGAQPQPAEFQVDGRAVPPVGKVVALLTGDAAWKGRTVDWQVNTNNNTGITTTVRAVDVRDDLYNKVVFGAINMIDERTGQVYSGIAEATIPTAFRDEIVGYQTPIPGYTGTDKGMDRPIPGMKQDTFGIDIGFLGYGSSEDIAGIDIAFAGFGTDSGAGFEFVFPTKLFDITQETGKIYPRDLLDWLCGICGFKTAYTPRAFDRLKNTNFGDGDEPGWLDSRYNVYNLDWSNGVKVGAALQTVSDALGLVFSPTNQVLEGDIIPEKELPDDFDTIRFYVQGEVDNPTFEWDDCLDFASHSIGEATQPDVDTGIWITGEPDRYEVVGRKVVAGWNQSYNRYAFDRSQMGQLIDELNEQFPQHELSEMVTTMEKLAEVLQDRDVAESEQEAFDEAKDNGLTDDEAIDAAAAAAEAIIENENPWAETNFLEGTKFKDMLIADYLDAIPFRVYRISGMEKVLKEDEFNGDRPVRRMPLQTPLLTDPTIDYLLRGHVCKKNGKKDDIFGLIADEDENSALYPVLKDGHRIIEDTGHIVFQAQQFEISPKEEDDKGNLVPDPGKDPADYKWYDVVPDTKLTIQVVFLGDPFRTFWGTSERIGAKPVSNLYRKFQFYDEMTFEELDAYAIIEADRVQAQALDNGVSEEEASKLWTAEHNRMRELIETRVLEPVVIPGEKPAEEIAEDIARSLLTRQRVVRSGSIAFEGIAGHEPDEVFRRVSVQIDAESGIRENVTYSDDQPELGMPSYYEIQNKIAVENHIRELELDKRKAELRAKRDKLRLAKKEALKPEHLDPMIKAALQTLNKDNWIRVKFHEDSTGTDKNYDIGEPVVGTLNEETKQYEAVEEKNTISSKDSRLLGINLVDNQGVGNGLGVCTQGVCMAKVKGVVAQGNYLHVDTGGEHLVSGGGPIMAMQGTPNPPDGEDPKTYVQKIRVLVGNNQEPVKIVDYAMTSRDLIIDTDDPPNPDDPDIPFGLFADAAETQRIEADDHEVEDGDIVLASNQDEEFQSVWVVVEDGPWLNKGQFPIVGVQRGAVYKISKWMLYYPEPTVLDPDPLPYYILMRGGWF